MSDTLEPLSKIRILVCDVDGVLTDGRLTYGDGGESAKTFHVRDGMGLRMLKDNGIEVGIITARSGAAVAKRMSDLGIEHVAQGRGDKGIALKELLTRLAIDPKHAAYVGDDIIDIPALHYAGVGFTVADAHATVLQEADYVASLGGGQGAVREICDLILDAQFGLASAIQTVLDRAVAQTGAGGSS